MRNIKYKHDFEPHTFIIERNSGLGACPHREAITGYRCINHRENNSYRMLFTSQPVPDVETLEIVALATDPLLSLLMMHDGGGWKARINCGWNDVPVSPVAYKRRFEVLCRISCCRNPEQGGGKQRGLNAEQDQDGQTLQTRHPSLIVVGQA